MEDELMLNTKWVFWYDYHAKKNTAQEEWKKNLNEMCTIRNVPSLLYALENIEELNAWPVASNIHFFRKNIQPAWEDKKNIEGGKWILEFSKSDDLVNIQKVWARTVALCVSEALKDEIVCGCVFSPRRFVNRFSIWTSKKDRDVLDVGSLWKKEVNAERYKELSFRAHKDALQGGTFWNKSIYSL